jgi:hypothetical protein
MLLSQPPRQPASWLIFDVRQKKFMKHYIVIFREWSDKPNRHSDFASRVWRIYPISTAEADAGVYIISTPDDAHAVTDKLNPGDLELSDVYLVLELGKSGVVGVAGTNIARALSEIWNSEG